MMISLFLSRAFNLVLTLTVHGGIGVTIVVADPQTQPEFLQLYKGIRSFHPSTPLVMLAGHRHIMFFEQLDPNAFAFESGRFFEVRSSSVAFQRAVVVLKCLSKAAVLIGAI